MDHFPLISGIVEVKTLLLGNLIKHHYLLSSYFILIEHQKIKH